MKKYLLIVLGALLFLPALAPAQTAPAPAEPQYQTFSLNTSVVALPGGKQTFAGMDSGITFTPTPNFDLLDRNLVATGAGFEYFAGGFNYRIKPLSIGLNNASPNVNGLRLQFFVTASAGVDRITSGTVTTQHYGFTAGGGVNYLLNAAGTWTLAAKVEYADFPGFARKPIVMLNPAFHF
jgi:hypothetical protein